MFLVIDGPDGTGKSTLCHNLVNHLNNDGFNASYTCEPTNTLVGKELRCIFANNSTPKNLLELIARDRRNHLTEVILPLIDNNCIVVCDRYIYANLVYQSIQGYSSIEILRMNKDFLIPDISIILNTNKVDLLIGRIANRKSGYTEMETTGTLQSAIDYYAKLSCHFPNHNLHYLDARLDTNDMLQQCVALVKGYKNENVFE